MTSLISYDYVCSASGADSDCGVIDIRLVDRNAVPEVLECEYCGAPAHRRVGAPLVLKASVPDGEMGRKRVSKLREQNKLFRAKVEAQRRGARDDLTKIATEERTLRATKGHDDRT